MEEEFYEDLLTAGHDILERNPKANFEEWVENLMKEYPAEIVDALGPDPVKVQSSLDDIWNNHFRGS